MLVKAVYYVQYLEHDPLLVIMNLLLNNHNLVQLNTMIIHKFMVEFHRCKPKYPIEFVVVADVPGIIRGASKEQQGLGCQFLRHIERCLALLLVIDMSVERPWEQYEYLMNELREYKMDLTRKPITILGNKIDDPDAKLQLEQTRAHIPYPLLPISTIESVNIDKLLLYLRKQYDEFITDQWRNV